MLRGDTFSGFIARSLARSCVLRLGDTFLRVHPGSVEEACPILRGDTFLGYSSVRLRGADRC